MTRCRASLHRRNDKRGFCQHRRDHRDGHSGQPMLADRGDEARGRRDQRIVDQVNTVGGFAEDDQPCRHPEPARLFEPDQHPTISSSTAVRSTSSWIPSRTVSGEPITCPASRSSTNAALLVGVGVGGRLLRGRDQPGVALAQPQELQRARQGQPARLGVGVRGQHRGGDHRVRLGQHRGRPEGLPVEGAARAACCCAAEVVRERERQPEQPGDLRAVAAGAEQPQRRAGARRPAPRAPGRRRGSRRSAR